MKNKLIQIKEDQLQKLKKKAKKNDRSVNAEIRQAINNHLKE